jgi:hypothetical protein
MEGVARMTLYILNTMVVPIDYDKVDATVIVTYRLTLEQARERVRKAQQMGELQSAISHEPTAQLLSRLLGVEIKPEYRTVYMQEDDEALHFIIKIRLPKDIDVREVELLPYWLVWSEIRATISGGGEKHE